jgi:hypothetical protein
MEDRPPTSPLAPRRLLTQRASRRSTNLTSSAPPTAGGTLSPASGTFYNAGAVVPVTATAKTGYSFNGCSGPVASAVSTSTAITMSSPQILTANFVATTELSASGVSGLQNFQQQIGVFRSVQGQGLFILNQSEIYNWQPEATTMFGLPGDIPVAGAWFGTGTIEIECSDAPCWRQRLPMVHRREQ